MPRRPLAWCAGYTVVVLAAARVSYLVIARPLGIPGVQAFKIEAAATVFVAAAALMIASSDRQVSRRPGELHDPLPGIAWLAFIMAAFMLYWPALGVGLLSDDFFLILQADHWQLSSGTPALFRPVTMAIWAVLRALGAGAMTFHALNIVLHGTAAFLTVRLATGWVHTRLAAVAAGALFLVLPVSVEPVTWIAGGFDVLATTLVLALIEIARRYDRGAVPLIRLLFFIVGGLALLSKETAVVGVALVALDAFVRRALRRPLLFDAIVLAMVGLAYGLARLSAAGLLTSAHVTRFVLQQGLFQAIGGLAQEWPALPVAPFPWQAVIPVVAILCLILHFVWISGRDQGRLVACSVAWILAAVAPVFTWILISEYLEGSRYLYLAAPAWAILVVAMASRARSRFGRIAAATGLGAIVVMSVWGTRVQVHAWTEAAAMRDEIIQQLRTSPVVRACPSIDLSSYPDNVRGAFVFRNGPQEALIMAGLPRMTATAPPACHLRWNDALQVFEHNDR